VGSFALLLCRNVIVRRFDSWLHRDESCHAVVEKRACKTTLVSGLRKMIQ
jgi:hypothetical protein